VKYDHKTIEAKWQEKWEKDGAFAAKDTAGEKEYLLIEFPYPSGDGLHVGHIRSWTALDVIARKRRAQGKNVLYPIGWDAFGLPTENYALKTGKDPRVVTKENTDNFRRQIKSLGISFDWSREINTTDPEYYKWTQWIFLKLYKKGLAYKTKTHINWCPKDKIGLANEEVIDGKCERCGSEVEKREKEQWMLAITNYAQRLYDDLDTVDYITPAKLGQRNWIGPSQGLIFSLPVKDTNLIIETFSTHYEAFYADTFVVIAPDHPLLPKLLEGVPDQDSIRASAKAMVDARISEARGDIKKVEGVFTGRYALDPVGNGELPIWIANYVLADYGTGIVKCSAHDERDFAFAKKYGIRLKPVLFPQDPELRTQVEQLEICYSDMKHGILTEPAEFAGQVAGEQRDAIAEYAEAKGLARKATIFKLRDWVFSRQRYWGEPIPMINCPTDGWVPVPDDQLPVELPIVEKYQPTDTGESPLANISEWVNTTCPTCGGPAKRETDVMPNWAGSSWYYLRYADPKNATAFASQDSLYYWTPVDWYNGGMEHTTLHLLYSRFWHKFLYDEGLVPTSEPYMKRTSHGLILAADGSKMSKSKGNVINPDQLVEQVGADSLRLFEMFLGPFDQSVTWNTDSIAGVRRFIERVCAISEKIVDAPMHEHTAVLTAQTIDKVSRDIDALKMNTAVSALMIFANHLAELEKVPAPAFDTLLQLLAPFAPHVASELWAARGYQSDVASASWPVADSSKLRASTVVVAVQINGKVRGSIAVAPDAAETEAISTAKADPHIAKWLGEHPPKKTIYVSGKVLNFVI
jgi:leucyl-tRNA synthetase